MAGLAAVGAVEPAAAQAIRELWAGETHVFTNATAGTISCRIGNGSDPCGPVWPTQATATPADNTVSTRVAKRITAPGAVLYATASVSNDFVIAGPPDQLVDVQISVNYDFSGFFLAAAEYTLGNVVQLRIQDRGRNEIVATHPLAQMQRQGDQGLTDISFAEQREVLEGEVAHFTVKLRRGGLYRLHFELQSSGVSFATNNFRASGTATFHWMSVSVDEDEAELLAGHDTAIKAELAILEDDHEQLMAEHAEILAKFGKIEDDLAEIKTLLLTPQGRRPGFPEDGAPPPGQQSTAPEEIKPRPARRGLWRRPFN